MDSSVLLSICGIAAVVGLLIIMGAFLLLRIMKMSVFGLGIQALRMFTEPKEEPSALDVRAQAVERPRSEDLRAQARSLDFDAAVARYSGKPANPTTPAPETPTFSAQSLDSSPQDESSTRRERLRRRRNEEHEVDWLESLAGDDDDDNIL